MMPIAPFNGASRCWALARGPGEHKAEASSEKPREWGCPDKIRPANPPSTAGQISLRNKPRERGCGVRNPDNDAKEFKKEGNYNTRRG
jgi:hypothetical protein